MNLGRPDSKNEGFVMLTTKSLMLIIPAILFGHYIDEFVDKKIKFPNKFASVVTQTIINILLIYVMHKISRSYTREFQVGLAGLFFSALFFSMQTHYTDNLKSLLI